MTSCLVLEYDERPLGGSSRFSSSGGGGGGLQEGMRVEARYRGKTRYYPGVIKRANRDGTFDIDYDDVSAASSSVESLPTLC